MTEGDNAKLVTYLALNNRAQVLPGSLQNSEPGCSKSVTLAYPDLPAVAASLIMHC
jgi:hypothetical protein